MERVPVGRFGWLYGQIRRNAHHQHDCALCRLANTMTVSKCSTIYDLHWGNNITLYPVVELLWPGGGYNRFKRVLVEASCDSISRKLFGRQSYTHLPHQIIPKPNASLSEASSLCKCVPKFDMLPDGSIYMNWGYTAISVYYSHVARHQPLSIRPWSWTRKRRLCAFRVGWWDHSRLIRNT